MPRPATNEFGDNVENSWDSDHIHQQKSQLNIEEKAWIEHSLSPLCTHFDPSYKLKNPELTQQHTRSLTEFTKLSKPEKQSLQQST